MPIRFRGGLVLAFLILAAVSGGAAPAKWEDEVARLVAQDADRPVPAGGVVFVGSSSIRLWTSLAADFPGVRVVNRGFGGSELADSVHFADRLVLPHRPAAVVVYAGENDLAAGKSPETVAADFAAFRRKIHAALPDARILFLSIKASPSREKHHQAFRRANELIAADCATDPRCQFVDVATPLLGADGRAREEFFQADRLHLNASGYAEWTRVLAPLLSR